MLTGREAIDLAEKHLEAAADAVSQTRSFDSGGKVLVRPADPLFERLRRTAEVDAAIGHGYATLALAAMVADDEVV